MYMAGQECAIRFGTYYNVRIIIFSILWVDKEYISMYFLNKVHEHGWSVVTLEKQTKHEHVLCTFLADGMAQSSIWPEWSSGIINNYQHKRERLYVKNWLLLSSCMYILGGVFPPGESSVSEYTGFYIWSNI